MADRSQLLPGLAAALGCVPSGRVVTLATLARHLGASRPEVQGLVTALDAASRTQIPWHRIVADGGAIGRHKWRDQQLALLVAEGVSVSPAGVVDGLADRLVKDLARPQPARARRPMAVAAPRQRSRGMKDRPGAK